MSVHIEEIAAAAYFYRGGEGYENGDEPVALATLVRKDHGEIEVMATMGELSRHNLRELVAQLQARGYRCMHIKRARGRRVPLGRMVRSDQAFDYYVVDL